MKELLSSSFDKYRDPTEVPLKSFEVAPGVRSPVLDPRVRLTKFADNTLMYIGKDGRDYATAEDLQFANDLFRRENYRQIEKDNLALRAKSLL